MSDKRKKEVKRPGLLGHGEDVPERWKFVYNQFRKEEKDAPDSDYSPMPWVDQVNRLVEDSFKNISTKEDVYARLENLAEAMLELLAEADSLNLEIDTSEAQEILESLFGGVGAQMGLEDGELSLPDEMPVPSNLQGMKDALEDIKEVLRKQMDAVCSIGGVVTPGGMAEPGEMLEEGYASHLSDEVADGIIDDLLKLDI